MSIPRVQTFSSLLTARSASPRAVVHAWDLPTRLFKWALVVMIVIAWVSTRFSDPDMKVHKLAGYAILVLVLYRLFWGAVGGSTARFSSFVRSPSRAIAYLREARKGTTKPYLGHNPAGGLMILALLFACFIQAVLGLFATDGVTASGPLADIVGDTVSTFASRLHGAWFYLILALAIVHITANLYYQFIKGEDLIGPMITGRKKAAAYQDALAAEPGSLAVAALCLLLASAIVYFGITAWGGSLLGEL
jgi:cytochrome b